MKKNKITKELNTLWLILLLAVTSCKRQNGDDPLAGITQPISVKVEFELIKRDSVILNYPVGVNVKATFKNQLPHNLYARNFLMQQAEIERLEGSSWKFYSSLQTTNPPFEIADTVFEMNTDDFTNRLMDSLLQIELAKRNAKQLPNVDLEVEDAAQSILYLKSGETYETNTGLVWLLNGSGRYRIFFHYDPNSKFGVNSWFIPLPEQLNGYQRLTKVIASDTLYLNIK